MVYLCLGVPSEGPAAPLPKGLVQRRVRLGTPGRKVPATEVGSNLQHRHRESHWHVQKKIVDYDK